MTDVTIGTTSARSSFFSYYPSQQAGHGDAGAHPRDVAETGGIEENLARMSKVNSTPD